MKKLVFAGLIIVCLLASIFFLQKPVLVIQNIKNPSEKIYFDLSSFNGEFTISYTHSVNKGRVHDVYSTENGILTLLRTEFVSYGAGMPEIEETPNAVFQVNDGVYTMEMNRKVGKELIMAVGVIAEHSVTVGNNEYFLKDFFKPQSRLKIGVKKWMKLKNMKQWNQ